VYGSRFWKAKEESDFILEYLILCIQNPRGK
jgi:hypothetical protein